MKWLFNRCRPSEANLSLLAAGVLPDDERAGVERHVASCPACQAKLAELRTLSLGLAEAGQRLPEVEAPASLRRRWVTAVRESARQQTASSAPFIPVWLSARRWAWGSLAAMWALVLFFRLAGPEAPKPAVVAAAPPSLREVLLALKVEGHRDGLQAAASAAAKRKPSPDALPPRSQVAPIRSTNLEVA